MKKYLPYLLILAAVAYYFLTKKAAPATGSNLGKTGGTTQVDASALAAYKAGTANDAQMEKLGWPFALEAVLSYMSGSDEAAVLGPMTNGPDVRAPVTLFNSGLTFLEKHEPAWNHAIDGFNAKLAYLNVQMSKYGRPRIYGFEDQNQPHNGLG